MDQATTLPEAPKPLKKTPFDLWLWERGFTNVQTGKALSCATETVRRWRLPFGDPARRIPDEEAMERIFEFTGGAIAPGDFYQVGAVEAVAAE